MDKNFNIWEKQEKIKETAGGKIKHGVGAYLNEIMLLACVALTVLVPLVSISFINPFSAEFIANTVYMAISTYICYLVFIPSGKRDGVSANRKYSETVTLWESLCAKIKDRMMLSDFCEYCRAETENERKEQIKRKVNGACIDYEVYCEKYAGRSRFELNALVRCGELKKEQMRAIMRAGKIKVNPISPGILISASHDENINDAGRRKMSYEQQCAVTKPIAILVSSLTFASAVLIPTNSIGIGIAVTVVSRIFGICMASFAGYSVGVNEIKWESERKEGKILFIERFFERCGNDERV